MTPDARLLITPECPHCPNVAEILMKLVKEGLIGRLEITNLAVRPEVAAEVGTRSVPWFRIGQFDYTGAHSEAEIRRWAEQAANNSEGWSAYYHDLIDQRELDEAIDSLKQHPERLCELIQSLGGAELPMVIKIGIGAIIEEFQDTPELGQCLSELEGLVRSEDAATRADAAHYLGLTGDPSIQSLLQSLLNDRDDHVREIASEALEEIEVARKDKN